MKEKIILAYSGGLDTSTNRAHGSRIIRLRSACGVRQCRTGEKRRTRRTFRRARCVSEQKTIQIGDCNGGIGQ